MKFLPASITSAFPIYFLFLLIIFCIFCARSRSAIKTFFVKFSCLDGIILAMLMAIGAALRIRGTWHIDLDPYGWRYIHDAWAIKTFFFYEPSVVPILSSAIHIPGYSFLLSLPLMLTKNLTAVSDFSMLFSILMIGLIYFLTYLITEDRLAAIITAGLLMTAKLAVKYGGMEGPLTISVFLTTLSFVLLVFWLKSGHRGLWMAAALAFLITVNIKVENILYFIPFFTVSFLKSYRQKTSEYGLWIQMLLIAVFAFSVVMFIPFIINHSKAVSWSKPGNMTRLLAPEYFFKHFYDLIVIKYHAFPIFIATGFAMIGILKKQTLQIWVILLWFVTSLLNFTFYADLSAEWNMLQIMVPLFVMTGYVLSETMTIFILRISWRYFAIAFILACFAYSMFAYAGHPKPYSWLNLKKDFPSISQQDCIISSNIRISAFALSFLFPDKHWIFLNKDDAIDNINIDTCDGRIYYFNPAPYGLMEETPLAWSHQQKILVEDMIQRFGIKYGGKIMPKLSHRH